jgi:hypothetical protein
MEVIPWSTSQALKRQPVLRICMPLDTVYPFRLSEAAKPSK